MSSHPMPPTGQVSDEPAYSDPLDTLFKTEASRLRRFFHRRTGDREIARDLTQEAFLRLSNTASFGDIGNPIAYLQRIAQNLLIDRTRRKSARFAPTLIPFEDSHVLSSPPLQSYEMEAQDLLVRYEAALLTLSAKSRNIFLMHRVDEMTYLQISDALKISISTVEYHMGRALSHLDRELEEFWHG